MDFRDPRVAHHLHAGKLALEEKPGGEGEREALRIELSFKEASLLLGRWLFECVWREQQAREQAARARANT